MSSDYSQQSVFGAGHVPGPDHGNEGRHETVEDLLDELRRLTREDVRQILRASEGIRSQDSTALRKEGGVSPARTGHAISSHLHSAERHDVELPSNKTKFLSLNDMAEALWQLLRTHEASVQVGALVARSRATVRAQIGDLFGLECQVPDPQGRGTFHRVRFTREEQRQAGLSKTTCVAIVERRQRGRARYFQIHTFYPEVSNAESEALLAFIRSQG
jgi:hypothetical protein